MKKTFLILMLTGVFNLHSQSITTTVNNGNLILEDIPTIPQTIKDDLKRYQNVRSGSFRSFTDTGDSIYISTRFGNVSQLHVVDQPGGARKQITFFDEPVGSMSRQPDGTLIAFTMDVGGSEHAQILLLNPENGVIVRVNKNTEFRQDAGEFPEDIIELKNELEKLQDWKSGVVKALWVLFSGLIGVLGWIFSEAIAKM